jgi:hypothetical protein
MDLLVNWGVGEITPQCQGSKVSKANSGKPSLLSYPEFGRRGSASVVRVTQNFRVFQVPTWQVKSSDGINAVIAYLDPTGEMQNHSGPLTINVNQLHGSIVTETSHVTHRNFATSVP